MRIMSSCEKCWSDAHRPDPYVSVAEEYERLIEERKGERACTPEQQAGPDARECPTCHRKVLHQYTGECMAGCNHFGKIGDPPKNPTGGL
jgi:hypothetical protein